MSQKFCNIVLYFSLQYLHHSNLVDFTKAFDSIHREKMEQILLAYSLPKKSSQP